MPLSVALTSSLSHLCLVDGVSLCHVVETQWAEYKRGAIEITLNKAELTAGNNGVRIDQMPQDCTTRQLVKNNPTELQS